MPTFYARRSSEENPKREENWLVWFSDGGIEGCKNALLLYGSGEIHLLKTVRIVGRDKLDELDFENWTSEDYEKWKEVFGTGAASNELRTTYRHFREVNDHL